MSILRALAAWFRDGLGLQLGELGDIFVAVELTMSAVVVIVSILLKVFA